MATSSSKHRCRTYGSSTHLQRSMGVVAVSCWEVRCWRRSSAASAAGKPLLAIEGVVARASSKQLELEEGNRAYLVWEVPGHPELLGIHEGPGTLVYHRLLSLGPGGKRLPFRSIRWKRILNFAGAEAALRELGPPGIPVPSDITLFTWEASYYVQLPPAENESQRSVETRGSSLH